VPGERQHEIGRAYATVLTGCLERTVNYFEQTFDAYSDPDKVSFSDMPGLDFSFDSIGNYRSPERNCEVFVESKGYSNGNGLITEYKEFLAKAYVTFSTFQRHRPDYFWFATNAPFGASIGVNLASPRWVYKALTDRPGAKIESLLGELQVDRNQVDDLSQQLSIGIFPDSFIRRMGIMYRIKPNENLWHIMTNIHAYRNFRFFEPVAALVTELNRDQISDPSNLYPGQRLHLPWFGIDWDDTNENESVEDPEPEELNN
jgi:hypothetical protein